jgi:rhodanese-related sulfurtransferase
MRNLAVVIVSFVLVLLLAACGGAPAQGGAVQPGPDAPVISPDTYVSAVADSDHILVDVRTPGEVASTGVIPGAINIPLDQLPSRANELAPDTTIVVYCNSGNRSRSAASILKDAGYTELLDVGGIQQWQRSGKQLVPLGQ